MGDTDGDRSDVVAEASSLTTDEQLERLRGNVLAVLHAELRDHALAEDVCQEAFRIVLERLARQPLEHPERLEGYVVQTARYLAVSHYRLGARRQTVTGQQPAIDATAAAEDPAARQHQEHCAAAMRRLLQKMRHPRDREILVRVYLHDQDKDIVCRELGIDEGHYKRVLHRARIRFAELLQRRYRRSDLFCIALF